MAGLTLPKPRASARLLTTIRLEPIITLAVMTAALTYLSPFFLSVSNIFNVLVSTAVVAVLAVGMTFVIASGGIDLSVGSIMAMTGVVGAIGASHGLPGLVSIAIMLVAGTLAGGFNGLLVSRLGIPAFIVTLATLSTCRGLALLFADGKPIYGLDETFAFIGQARIGGVPVPVVVMVVLVGLGHLILHHTRFGLRTLALGDNEMSVRVTGCNVAGQKLAVYALSGAGAALAGVLFDGRINAGDPTAGVMYELSAISAVVIGGTSLAGGRGTVVGSLLGALIIGVLQNGLNLLAVPAFYQYVAIGAILIFAVVGGALWPSRG